MTLMREEKNSATSNGIHSYEVQKIEVLDNESPSTSNGVGSQSQSKIGSSYPLAKLLKGVEKAHDKGKYLLDESEKRSETVREHRVYHGSGADFDHFDHSHMGEGEGAQAFGWGAYVTEVEGIGRAYAEQNPRYIEHEDWEREEAQNEIAEKIEDFYGIADGIEEVFYSVGGFDILDVNRDRASLEKWKEYFLEHEDEFDSWEDVSSFDLSDEDSAEEFARTVERSIIDRAREIASDYDNLYDVDEQRILYTVEIPDDTGENYLDWDKAVSESVSEKIARKIVDSDIDAAIDVLEKYHAFIGRADIDIIRKRKNEINRDKLAKMVAKDIAGFRGESVYNELTSLLGSDKKASEFLSSLGFTGIKYPADFMRGGREDGKQNYVIFNEADAKITDHVRFFRTADGEAYGFTIGGKIYIDPRIANSETPIHEYAHLWATALRNGNAEEWKNVVELMKDTKVWDEVKRRYPELEAEDDIADEVLATYSGRRGAERLRKEMDGADGKAKGALERVKQALQKFWKATADMLHIHYTTAEEVADRVMKDLLDGVDPRKLGSVSNDPIKGIERAAEAYREEQRLKLQKKNGEDDEMFVSLQNKKGKEYYDTVTELARRIAVNEEQERGRTTELPEQSGVQGEHSGGNAEDGHESISLLRGAIHIIAQERRRALGENGERNRRRSRNKQGNENIATFKDKRGASADTKSRKEIERRVYEWAQANDMLFSEDEVRANSYGGKLLGKGSEAHAYLTKDRSKVIKFVKPDFFTDRKDLGGYAEYIDNFNNVFPDTAYKIIGMSKDGRGKILVVTEQPFVDGKQLSANGWEKNNCDDKVRRYFANKGFEDLYGDAIYFGNDDYYVSDIGCGNVVFKNGEPVVIDANVLPMSVIKEQQRIENEKKVAKANREIYYLESEIQNERNVIEYFKEKRNDENKESIDGFIARHEQKIKELQKRISDKKAELGEGVHYRVEEEPLPTVWLPKDEYAKLSSAIHTNGQYENGKVGSEFTDNNFYLYTYRGDGRFDVNMKLPIEGNEEIIDILRKGTENGTIESAADIASTFEASGHGSDWYNNNNASSERRRGGDVGFGRLSSLRQSHERRGDEHVDTELSQSASAEHISKAIEKTARQTGGKVKQVHSVEEVDNEQVRKDIEDGKEVTGWYDEKTGEVHLYMPNIHDTYTAEKTVWHETVGHKGMRGLLGDKFHTYLRSLWMDMDNPVFEELHKYVRERMAREPMSMYDAIEEFIAEAAEKGRGEVGFWNNVRNKVADALRNVGYRLCPNVKDVKYMARLIDAVDGKNDKEKILVVVNHP